MGNMCLYKDFKKKTVFFIKKGVAGYDSNG